MRLVQSLDFKNRIDGRPFQKPGFPESVGLTVVDCERQAWVIFPDGDKSGGAGAINWALAIILQNRLPVWFYQLPVVRGFQDVLYGWVERNRGKFPGVRPYCDECPDDCGTESAAN
jgi:hypothetical protein